MEWGGSGNTPWGFYIADKVRCYIDFWSFDVVTGGFFAAW